jgi:hypothetical protein
MKRIFLTGAALLALIQGWSQNVQDTTGFSKRKLKLDEVNVIISYYTQEGDHASVTGGKGSQQLNDNANIIDLRLVRYNKKNHKQSIDLEFGVDYYTSASSDRIDLAANSSASANDLRFYPSLAWTTENEAKGKSFTAGVSGSTEFDYQSWGANIGYSKKTKDRSGEFSGKFQAYIDRLKLIAPSELRPFTSPLVENGGTAGRNTFSASLSWTQIVNERLQLAFLTDLVQQSGFLSLPFHRVYFKDGSVHQEKLPDKRFKLSLAIRANYFAGDKLIIRSYYRFYTDSWGIRSHTANLELPVKFSAFFSITPFYRYYHQNAAKYFAAFQQHDGSDQWFTSNYDLSNFSSHFFGTGFRLSPLSGIFGISHFNMIELRYGYYTRNDGLSSHIVSVNLRFKKI